MKNTQEIFTAIASQYDKVNSIVSLGTYSWMLRTFVSTISAKTLSGSLLDLGAGTGELSIQLLKRAPFTITMLDLNAEMLHVAKKRTAHAPCHRAISIIQGDALDLPFLENSFDTVCAAFLLRNVSDYERCFSESLRVVKPKGSVFFLELSRPKNPLFAALHCLYLNTCIPTLGAFYTNNKDAYSYLSKSILKFPDDTTLSSLIENAKPNAYSIRPIMGGIARIIILEK